MPLDKAVRVKFLRYGPRGQERPGLLDQDGAIRDLSGELDELGGMALDPDRLAALASLDLARLPIIESGTRLGSCIPTPGKFICIGLNYADHAAETGTDVPREPILFFKASSAISGPGDDIEIPRGASKTDWEVELGVVIGRTAKYVSEAAAAACVAGYCVVNDLSERAFQMERCGQWVKGKSHDTFGPVGPWLVTTDEVPEPQCLDLWLEVDGHRHQQGNTRTMVYTVPRLVSYISQFMTLQPGDIISTGTPPGVGHGHKPEPVYLRPGQELRLSVEGLGEQCYRTVSA